jgi:hypothetical protein
MGFLHRLNKLGLLSFLLILMPAAFGCSDSGSPPGDGVDTDPPVVTGVAVIDMGHIEVEFDEAVDKNTAERRNHYTIVEQAAMSPLRRPLSPGDTLDIGGAVLEPGGTKVMLTLWDMMSDVPYNIYVHGVRDVHGNGMTETQSRGFTGTTAQDNTPPELIARSPSAGQMGVGLSQSVIVQFSEELNQATLYSGFYWTGGGGSVNFTLDQMENSTYVFSPVQSLDLNTQYTVGFAMNTVIDWGGNYLAAASWTFRTTGTTDLIRPTVTATSPANGATNVPLDANLSIEFSEAIDPTSMDEEGVLLSPDPGEGIPTWTNGNRKLTFDPDNPLLADTKYSMLIPPGAVRDLAGNPLAGGENVIFTTGSALPVGSFSGTVAGDATSPEAADPAGAVVVAFLVSIEDFDSYEDGPPHGGSGIVDASGNYTIANLLDDVYYPLGILDSNNDGRINPELGDAIGVYGVDFHQFDFTVDSVSIAGGGSVTDIDFPLFDPVTIAGTVSYGGTNYLGSLAYYQYYVGAFLAATFDTSQGIPEPDYTTYGNPIAGEPDYHLSQFDDRMAPGSWYVGAYMDVNYNQTYDPDIDPVGFHMDGDEFGVVTVENGHDELDIDIVMVDPVSGAGFSSRSWRANANAADPTPALRGLLSPAVKAALKQALDRSR